MRYHGFDRWLHARFMLLFAVNGGLHIAALLKAMGLLGLPWSVLKGLVPSRANAAPRRKRSRKGAKLKSSQASGTMRIEVAALQRRVAVLEETVADLLSE